MLKTIDNDLLREAINEIYNQWFNRYKNYEPNQWSDGLINKCIDDMGRISTKYDGYPVIANLLLAFWQELVARFDGGYKDAALKKQYHEEFKDV